jgi:hypothetical protein
MSRCLSNANGNPRSSNLRFAKDTLHLIRILLSNRIIVFPEHRAEQVRGVDMEELGRDKYNGEKAQRSPRIILTS